MLAFSQKIAWPPGFQIIFCDLKTVICLVHDFQTLFGFGIFVIRNQDAVGLLGASTDTSAQLMKLTQTKAFGVFDHHDDRIGYIDADLDDGGGYQQLDFSGGKSIHDAFFVLRAHFSMRTPTR